MSKRVSSTIEISLSPLQIYAFLSDIENLPYFWDKIKRVEKVSGTGEVGTVYNLIMPTLVNEKKVPVQITQKLVPLKFEFMNESTSSKPRTGFRISETEGGSEVELYRETDFGLIGSILTLSLVGERDLKMEFDKILAALKEFVERDS